MKYWKLLSNDKHFDGILKLVFSVIYRTYCFFVISSVFKLKIFCIMYTFFLWNSPSLLQVQHWTRSYGPAILFTLEQSSYKSDRRADLAAGARGALRCHSRLRGRNCQGEWITCVNQVWINRYSCISKFAGTSNHTLRLQSVFRDDFPTESASTSHHLFERCTILRDALPARLHV